MRFAIWLLAVLLVPVLTLAAAPTINSVAISPSDPLTNETLRCTFNVTDSDNDDLTIAVTWYRDRKGGSFWEYPLLDESWTITASDHDTVLTSHTKVRPVELAPGEEWRCGIAVNDSTSTTRSNSSDEAIGNVTGTILISASTSTAVTATTTFTMEFRNARGYSMGDLYLNGTTSHPIYDSLLFDEGGVGYQRGFVLSKSDAPRVVRAYNGSAANVWNYSGFASLGSYVGIEKGDFDRDNITGEITVIDLGDRFNVINHTGGTIEQTSYRGATNANLADSEGDGYRDDYVSSGTSRQNLMGTTDGATWTETYTVSNTQGAPYESRGADLDGIPGDEFIYATLNSLVVYDSSGNELWNISGEALAFTILDIDHDGKMDDIVYDQGGYVRAVNETGDQYWNYSRGGAGREEFITGDFDGDGWYDDFVSRDGSGGIEARNNDSSIIWEDTAGTDTGSGLPYSLVLHDVNLDGWEDILYGGNANIFYIVQNGSIVYSDTFSDDIAGTVNDLDNARSIDADDWDGDGIAEILVSAGSTTGEYRLYGWVDYCEISFNDSTKENMTWSFANQRWEYERTFTAEGNYSYNITCAKPGYNVTQNSSWINVTPAMNTPPTVDAIDISPSTPNASQDLTCSFTISDPDVGETLTANVTWYRNDAFYSNTTVGVSDSVQEDVVLGSGNTTLGENWTCQAQGYDEEDYGTAANSSTVVIQENTQPIVQSVSITPATPQTSDDLNCSFTITDSESTDLTVNVTWYRNDAFFSTTIVAAQNNTENSSILGSANTAAGEAWRCQVRPNDGTVDGSAQNSSTVAIAISCGSISSDTTLSSHLSSPGSTCFTVGSNGITINCNGFNISGDDTVGTAAIDVAGYDNVVIRNCIVKDFYSAIDMGNGASGSTLENISTHSNYYGIDNPNAGTGTISDFTSNNDTYGMYIAGSSSSDNVFTNITVTGGTATTRGIWVSGGGDDNTFTGVTINVPSGQFGWYVDSTGSYRNSLDCQGGTISGATSGTTYGIIGGTNTSASNCTVRAFERGVTTSNNGTYTNLRVIGSGGDGLRTDTQKGTYLNNITVINSSSRGMWIYNSESITLLNINASGNTDGIYLQTTSDSRLENITLINNSVDGLELNLGSSRNNITNLDIDGQDAGDRGLYVSGTSVNNTFIGIDITINGGSHYGIYSPSNDADLNYYDCQGGTIQGDDSSSTRGIFLNGPDNNTIANCSINDFAYGILIQGTSANHTISGVSVDSSATYGISFDASSDSGSSVTSSSFCNSGTTDANDGDSNTWTGTICDSSSGGASCTNPCPPSAPAGSRWSVHNSGGSAVATIDITGDLFLSGMASESQSSLSPPEGSFIIVNATDDPIIYISTSGNLFLIGTITQYDSSTPSGSTLQVWNATDDSVAYFDNQGNLYLRGALVESGTP